MNQTHGIGTIRWAQDGKAKEFRVIPVMNFSENYVGSNRFSLIHLDKTGLGKFLGLFRLHSSCLVPMFVCWFGAGQRGNIVQWMWMRLTKQPNPINKTRGRGTSSTNMLGPQLGPQSQSVTPPLLVSVIQCRSPWLSINYHTQVNSQNYGKSPRNYMIIFQ